MKLKEFIITNPVLQEIWKGPFLRRKQKSQKYEYENIGKNKTLTEKGKHLVKAVDQPILKLVWRLKATGNYNNKLRGKKIRQKKQQWQKYKSGVGE